MKGATAVPDSEIKSPRSSSTTMSGISQYFFCWRSIPNSSPTKELSRRLRAISLKSSVGVMAFPLCSELTEIASLVGRDRLGLPVGGHVRMRLQMELVPAGQAKGPRQWREQSVEDDSEDDPRHGPADRVHERHPADEDRPYEAGP